ncbi:MAG: hypothetical protein V7K27_11830 [Nostoc sp.]|uniref:hypothetical protein n=1 Tax=Nostoc sp. TaxID=1180 RepID=UPI002FFC620B
MDFGLIYGNPKSFLSSEIPLSSALRRLLMSLMQKMHNIHAFSAILPKNRNNLYDFNRNLSLSYEYRNCYINIIQACLTNFPDVNGDKLSLTNHGF